MCASRAARSRSLSDATEPVSVTTWSLTLTSMLSCLRDVSALMRCSIRVSVLWSEYAAFVTAPALAVDPSARTASTPTLEISVFMISPPCRSARDRGYERDRRYKWELQRPHHLGLSRD